MTTSENQSLEQLYEFGPFRVDPARETLLKEGVAVPLTPKTFQILLVLVRHGKEIVTKDDLMKTVWPDTFVEEANLSRNIFMLRKALGETAQDHRYIVTVPGRGYRLAEQVHLVPGQEFALAAASHTTVHIETRQTAPWKRFAFAAVLLVVLAGAVGLWRIFSARRSLLNEKDTVVLAGFANTTGDPMFDETLRQGLSIELRESPYLSLISDQRVAHALRLMGNRPDARLTPELARGICERTGSTATLEGLIAPLGSQYVLTLLARSCRTGEVLAQEQAQAARKEDVLTALSQMGVRFRNRVGESLATLQEHNTPLAEATTPSLEALEAYSAGWKLHTSSSVMAALPLLMRAVKIDPDFALAQATLAREYADLDQPNLAAETATRAWQARAHAGDREKFYIVATYEGLATGNLEAARQNDEAWAHSYPRDPVPHSMLSGYPNKAAGRYQQAIVEARRSIELDPDFAIAYYNLGVNHVYLDQLDEAEKVLRRAAGRGLGIDELLMLQHDIAFLKGDQATMQRVAAQAREQSGGDTWISNKEAYALAYTGQLQKAAILSRRAIDQALQESQPERAGLFEAGAALRAGFFGEAAEARLRAMSALHVSSNREIEFGAALALAMSGDAVRARALADDLEKRSPADTVVRFNYLPVLRARIALDEKKPEQAIELLQSTGPYELGASRLLFGALYPAYVRGEAYLAAGKGREAAVEFQKILDHRGVVGSDPIGALARLQLGRAYASSGDKIQAKATYQNFLTLWNEADSDLPALKDAKSEFREFE